MSSSADPTSSTSQSSAARLRNRARENASPLNQVNRPNYYISSGTYGPALQNEVLEDVALVLVKIDSICIEVIEVVVENVVSGQLTDDPAAQAIARREQVELRDIRQQFNQINQGISQIHQSYLDDTYMLRHWSKVSRVFSQFLDISISSPGNTHIVEGTTATLKILENDVLPLPEKLLEATKRGQLAQNTRTAIRDRLLMVDWILDRFHEKKGTPRVAKTWPQIAEMIKDQERDNASSRLGTRLPQRNWVSSLMWLTFISIVLCAIPTVALAWQYSPHLPGASTDADFWFLMQSCSMQSLSLLTAGVPMWKGKQLSKHEWSWTWGFMALALLSTIIAPVLYLKVPTEWSAFCVVVAGAVQAFVLLQVTLVGEA